MADVPLRAIVKQLESIISQLQSTVYTINSFGNVVNIEGSPEGVIAGRFALDVTNEILYVNPNPSSTTGWIPLA